MQTKSNQSQMSFNLSSQSSRAEISVTQLEKMISLVMNASEAINRPKLKNLALIRESPRSAFSGGLDSSVLCCSAPVLGNAAS